MTVATRESPVTTAGKLAGGRQAALRTRRRLGPRREPVSDGREGRRLSVPRLLGRGSRETGRQQRPCELVGRRSVSM